MSVLLKIPVYLISFLFAFSFLLRSERFRLSFVKAVTYFYDLCLYNRKFHAWYILQWIICLFFLLLFKSWVRFFIVLLIFIVWRFFFVFPYKKRKVVNTVMGPPGSGKTTFCAFINKWASAIGEPVYSNVPLKGSFKFSWDKDFGWYDISNATILIDEAALEDGLNSRDFKSNFADVVDKKTGKLLFNGRAKLQTAKLHRHYGLDMWVFSQADDSDIKIRELSQNYYILRKTGFPWLLKIRLYDTDIDLDPMTQDFRKIRIKKRTYFLFSPVVWLSFDTEDAPVLPDKPGGFILRSGSGSQYSV